MCLLAVVWKTVPEWPLIVLANRDEVFSRLTDPPRIHIEHRGGPAWLGGTDRTAGGTWLGVNSRGVFVAVTNRPKRVAAATRSRGLLCRDLLSSFDARSACREALQQLRVQSYAGLNIMALDFHSGCVIEAGDTVKSTALEPGVHILTNGDLDDRNDGRIARVRAELQIELLTNPGAWLNHAAKLCGACATEGLAAVCLEDADRGTVSSAILMLASRPVESQFHYAPGPPSRTPYEDLSSMLVQLQEKPGV